MENLKSQKGLTLVELLAVIVIMGIIAAIAVPAIGKIVENSRIKATKGEALVMLSAAQLYFIETPVKFGRERQAASLPDLVAQGYMESKGYLNTTSYVTNVNPAKICARSEGETKVNFYNATAEQISNSKNDLDVGNETCGENDSLIPPNKDGL